jgi:hypothetical protein
VVEAVDLATRAYLKKEGMPEWAIEQVAPIWDEPILSRLTTKALNNGLEINTIGRIKDHPRSFLALSDRDKELILYRGICSAYESHLREAPQCACPRSSFIERYRRRAVDLAEIGLKDLKRGDRPWATPKPGTGESFKDLIGPIFALGWKVGDAQDVLRRDFALKGQVTELIREVCTELARRLLAWREEHRTRSVADTRKVRSDAD